MNKIESLKSAIQTISSNYKRQSDNYNPLKYVRGSKLIDESFLNSNFPELNFSKNLKEWKENQKKEKKNNLDFDDYLSKAKSEMQNAEAKNNFNIWKNFNNNSSNPDFSKNSSDKVIGPTNSYSSDNLPKQNGFDVPTNAPNKNAIVTNSNGNLDNNTNSNNNLYTNNLNYNNNEGFINYSSSDFKEKQLNYSVGANQAAPLYNLYENNSLQKSNLNTNQTVQAVAHTYNHGFYLNRDLVYDQFPINQIDNMKNNNFSNTFPSTNAGNFDMNEFYNVNNLYFPK